VIRSMTGFARAESAIGAKKCVVELRTVNHRFLEFGIRLPAKDMELEKRIKKLFDQKVSRGYVEVAITVGDGENVKKKLALDEDLVKQFLVAAETLKKKYGVGGAPDLVNVLSLKDIFKYEEDSSGIEERWSLIKPALDSAINNLLAMRATEGEALKKDIVSKIDIIAKSSDGIMQERKKQEADILEKYKKKIEELAGGESDPQRILMEAAVMAERSDISEEIVRLGCHIGQIRELLDNGGGVGRKLEFITQEMNREANTIGSKSTVYGISREVVEIKSNLEKIREQTANIE
jgi:uncharacterized protein (TIGR00255 family)